MTIYCLQTRAGKLLAENDELLAYLTRGLALFARKCRGYDELASARYCKIVKKAIA